MFSFLKRLFAPRFHRPPEGAVVRITRMHSRYNDLSGEYEPNAFLGTAGRVEHHDIHPAWPYERPFSIVTGKSSTYFVRGLRSDETYEMIDSQYLQ